MRPDTPLPISPSFSSADEYVCSLLEFSRDPLFQALSGGVHILDFFTRDKPHDLYTTVLPAEWRQFFAEYEIDDILDLLLRKDLDTLENDSNGVGVKPPCPHSLRNFIQQVRDHCLRREFIPLDDDLGIMRERKVGGRALFETEDQLRHFAIGMKPKKLHEVGLPRHQRFFFHHHSSPPSPTPLFRAMS